MGQNRKKLPCLKIRIFVYPAVIDCGQNLTLRLWRQITVGNFLGPYWGQWGPIGAKNGSKTLKNYHAPKLDFLATPVIDFGQNLTVRLWCQIMVRTTKGPSWGQWGPIGAKKWVKTAKNCHAPKFELTFTPRSSI